MSFELLEADSFVGDCTHSGFFGALLIQCNNTQLVCTAACDRPGGGEKYMDSPLVAKLAGYRYIK